MSVTVPEGLSELLEEFAVSVLREKPTDLVEFAARYFNDLYMSRKQEGGKQSAAVVSELAGAAEVEMDAEGDLLTLGYIKLNYGVVWFLCMQFSSVKEYPLSPTHPVN